MVAPVLCLCLVAAGQVHAQAPTMPEEPGPGRASLPLEELLGLYREADRAAEPAPERPPVLASVDQLDLEGQLLDRTVDLSASVAVTVLDDEHWVTVPLLRRTPSVSISNLPQLDSASLTVVDGFLALVTRRKGRYRFDLDLGIAADVEGRRRMATLEIAEVTSAGLRVSFDASSFSLRGPAAAPGRDDGRLLPDGRIFPLEWERVEPAPDASPARPAPPAEPVVSQASISSVSTLEGRRLTRARFEATVSGQQELTCTLAPGQVLERVVLNGAPLQPETTVETASNRPVASITMAPARSGGTSAVLELLLHEQPGSFHLAGEIHLELPACSWPIHELFLTLHLPEVFTYTWESGSMEPISNAPRTPFTIEMPTPGSELTFHQSLITGSSPRLAVAYTVNLEGQYYRPPACP
jgi:hypothetical protein